MKISFLLIDRIEEVDNVIIYDPYTDSNLPQCNCADWGMAGGCLSSCQRENYIKSKRSGKQKIITGKVLDITISSKLKELLEDKIAILSLEMTKYLHADSYTITWIQ